MGPNMYFAQSQGRYFWQDMTSQPGEHPEPSVIGPVPSMLPYEQTARRVNGLFTPEYRNASHYRLEPVIADTAKYLAVRDSDTWTREQHALFAKVELYEKMSKAREPQARMNELRAGIVSTWATVLGYDTGRYIVNDTVQQSDELLTYLSQEGPRF